MTEPRTIILAGKPIDVPALPLRLTRRAYFLCRKLANDGFQQRYLDAITGGGVVELAEEEIDDLAEIAFLAASAADPQLTREAFDNWTVTPPELVDAYFPIRLQTGGWVSAPEGSEAPQEGQEQPGEAVGAI